MGYYVALKICLPAEIKRQTGNKQGIGKNRYSPLISIN